MIPVEKALEIVLAHAVRLPNEEVDLAETPGRVLAETVTSDIEMPPFDRAVMDGYAFRADDVAQAPARLEIAGQVRAGQFPERVVETGQAIQVMTGAPVPPGARPGLE